MTVKELIEKLKEYEPETKVKFDYGGHIEDIDDLYECNDFILIG
ncbi:hypothetical protein [Bacillus xiapuensis]|uniref:Uncharacterized protein n=1 Tax=Bacillus xiapuensis TaxID=2014075 RepID=A0ABU6N834_9BACI|nr:hypothetical protein [Bacillus xiapuensis]